VVGVALDTVQQIESHLITRNYEGFTGPRGRASAVAPLDAMLDKLGRSIDRVVSLEVPMDRIVDRVTGRRVCQDCGQTYHVRYTPPPSSGKCHACGGTRIVQRKDDTEEVVRKRYEEYQAKTAPVLDHYGEKGLVATVDGVGSLEEVNERIRSAIA
jgi:adenylate kinase